MSEALHYPHLRELDLQTVPKMMRGSLMRHLGVFTKLRRLVFGSSTGDMTIHITKVGVQYPGLVMVRLYE